MLKKIDSETWLTILCGVFLVIGFIPGLGMLHYAAVAFGGVDAVKDAWGALRERKIDVHLLMILAAVGAIAVGHVADAAGLLFLFSLSTTLEHLSMARTRNAIESLMKLRPDTAICVRDGVDVTVPIEEVKAGDLIRVPPFEQVPADGELTTERASIDESAMTGESRPVEKVSGESVMAGTQNQSEMLVLRVTSEPGDTMLDRIVRVVEEAQDRKASGERISEWFGQRYTIFVIVVFALSLVVRLLLKQPTLEALMGSIVLLVALSPCALVISSPAATLSAMANAARQGILVRGGEYIELVGKVDAIAMDKTGTITEGKPSLREVCVSSHAMASVGSGPHAEGQVLCWYPGHPMEGPSRRALQLAATAEAFSTHPIASALVRGATSEGIPLLEAKSHTAVAGKGVRAEIDGETVSIGQPKLFVEQGLQLPDEFRDHVREMQSRGLTAVLMHSDSGWACFGMIDSIRPGVKETLHAFKKLGVGMVAMITGDHRATAESVAKDIELDQVFAGLMPEDKSRIIADWTHGGKTVMMVGDGVNDAPALASAHLGVAMGGLGSDVALNASDVVLVRDRIDQLPELIDLGKRTNRIIRFNLVFAAGIILLLTILSFFWSSLPLRQWSPTMPLLLAVIGHEGSTVVVILNSLRLLKRKPVAL